MATFRVEVKGEIIVESGGLDIPGCALDIRPIEQDLRDQLHPNGTAQEFEIQAFTVRDNACAACTICDPLRRETDDQASD